MMAINQAVRGSINQRASQHQGWNYMGFVHREYEYRRYDTGAKPYFPPLRFPGQYWDEETDLFENWHRNYYALVGRYLSPEPMLQNPAYVRRMAQTGMSVPTYAYALNNPLRYIDPTGLAAECPGGRWIGAPMFVGDLSIGVAGTIGFLGVYSCLSAPKTVVVASICGFASVPTNFKKMEKHAALWRRFWVG